jgi:putative FmdB family regulatory protein
MPTYIYVCEPCNCEWEDTIKYDERDNPQACPGCNQPHTYRAPPAPAVLKASYHMGYNRGAAFSELKEIAKLKEERANLGHKERGDIDKEIGNRTRVAARAKDKSE